MNSQNIQSTPNPNYIELTRKVESSLYLNNLDVIKEILKIENYLTLNQNEKEQQIFLCVTNMFNYFNMAEKFLKYLIFDYHICEENSINYKIGEYNAIDQFSNVSDNIKNMFEMRDFHANLQNELDTNNDKNSKKLKV